MSLDPAILEKLREQLRFAYDPLLRGYDRLMATRVRTVLMVSNAYESFSIARDASLEFSMYGASQALRLRIVPQLTTALSGAEALGLLARERFDLVLLTANVPDMEVSALALAAKRLHPDVPVAMLAFDGEAADLSYGGYEPEGIDWVFAWRGSASVLLSIVKLAEDRANLDRDLGLAAIGAVLVIEDSVERYSTLLPLLYTSLLKHTLELTPEGINEHERQVRSRVRPKVLLARDFGEAQALVDRYGGSLLGIISDLRTLRDDRVDPEAGPRFLRAVAPRLPGVPILVQSSEPDAEVIADSVGARCLDKRSPRTAEEIERFVLEGIGFGSFCFTDALGREHARVHDLWEMEQALGRVADSSLLHVCNRNELSRWFRARGETTLASIVRPAMPADFASTDDLRQFMRSAVALAREEKHRGEIADFRRDRFDPAYPFLVIGKGSLGGKGRGLAFLFHQLSREKGPGIEGIRLRVPTTLVIATGEFDAFLAENQLDPAALWRIGDEEIRRIFRAARLPARLEGDLRAYVEKVAHPLAVRSSSLLEDSHHRPCAGLYSTYFLSNAHPESAVRLAQLREAIALVYASVFYENARRYREATGMAPGEEKMAVVLQELVGTRHGELFYPTFAGVAQSHNYYPVCDLRPEDGAATLALGLGKHVVEGGESLRFSPKQPRVLPQFSSVAATLKASQRDFLALRLDAAPEELGESATLVRLPLARAEQDGELQAVGSVVSLEDDRIYDGLARRGARVVTFSRLLRDAQTPLCRLLRQLLDYGRQQLGCAHEIELAANVRGEELEVALLQIRPFVAQRELRSLAPEQLAAEKLLCRSERALGHGTIEGVRDLLYVHPARYDRATSRECARLVGEVNARLAAERRPFVLVGPGRWGSLDPWLGIPVVWFQLSHARVIVEVPSRDVALEPSQGTHFFHNVVSAGIAYLSIPESPECGFFDFDRLDALPGEEVSPAMRLVRLDAPLQIQVDGVRQVGVIALP